ncbi:MAG: alanine--tRNA ligase-related protein [Chthoniobacterales bacterium]
MEKVFWENPYQTSLITKVAKVCGNTILLDETIAFSFSGGQESDTGSIHKSKILHSEKRDALIYYTIEDDHALQVGDTVTMRIDWERRYKLMRLHFATELILELVTRKLGLEKIGAHIAENKARVDFVYVKNISSIFGEVLDDYQKIIEADRPIKTGFTNVEAQRRFWEIEGFAKVACGGTHVKSTREVGMITLKRVNIGRGKERIDIKLFDPDLLSKITSMDCSK